MRKQACSTCLHPHLDVAFVADDKDDSSINNGLKDFTDLLPFPE